jgi:hypothetical protein
MSLPVSQQRVLDEIRDHLRASEPRLAGMFAIFTRLNLGEPRPRREELPIRRGLLSVTATPPRAGLMASTPRDGRKWCGLGTGGRARRRTPVLALIAFPIAVVLAVAGLLIGLGVPAATRSCGTGHSRAGAVTRVADPSCRAQAGPFGYPFGSK